MQAQEWRVDSALLERCKWHLLFHLFIVTATLPREVPEPENHFIREMLHAWSLKTSPHPPTSSPKHFQSDFLNLGFLLWVELWELGEKRRGEKPSPYREEQIESHQGVCLKAVGKSTSFVITRTNPTLKFFLLVTRGDVCCLIHFSP